MEKTYVRSWWGILTNLQKQELIKKYCCLVDSKILTDYPQKGMSTYYMVESDKNLLNIAQCENIDCVEFN